MSRVKRGNVARNRRKKVLKLAKGYRGSLSKLFRPAQQTVLHSLSNMYKDRRRRKRQFRQLWISRLNAALSQQGISYSKFMGQMKEKNVGLNRKVLSELAIANPAVFNDVVAFVQK